MRPVTALVNSAGVDGGTFRIPDLRFDVLDELARANVVCTMLCWRGAVRRMSTGLGFGGGAIVNVSSMVA